MTDFTTLSNTAVGVGGLPSGATVTALRDNPLAIAEGTSGAPKVQGLALENVYIGSANNTGTTESAFVLPDGVDILKLEVSGITATGSIILQIAFSTDGGSSYGSWGDMQSMSAACNYMGSHILDFPASTQRYVGLVTAGTVSLSGGGITIPSGANAIKFRMSTSGGGTHTYRVHAYVIGGVA